MPLKPRTRARVLGPLCLAACCAAGPLGFGVAAQPAAEDAAFVSSLSEAGAEVNARRLARWLFGSASTLDGGKSSVRLLQDKVAIRDSSLDGIRKEIAAQYERYEASADRFRAGSGNLLDWPDSRPFLFRTLMNGNDACLQLHAYIELVERFGVGPAGREGIRSSVEACDRFRRVAFQPAVVDLLERALRSVDDMERELSELRVELGELERLLQDLRRIEAGE